MGVIEDFGLGAEILQMDKEGMSLREIREELIKRHPEIPRIPSVNSIKRFLDQNRYLAEGEAPNRFRSLHYTNGNPEIKRLNEDLYQICLNNASNDGRKAIADAVRHHRKEFNDFLQEYEGLQKQTVDTIVAWTEEIIASMVCQNCQNIAKDKALEVLKRNEKVWGKSEKE